MDNLASSSRPRLPASSLSTSNLPSASASEAAATDSPARGAPMIQNLRRVLRAPRLVHAWEFWHDRQDRSDPKSTSSASPSPPPNAAQPEESDYASRLVRLHTISDVKEFWELFNNFPISNLPLRDSVHLFHKGVKPVWEDPRNERGGAWTFRVRKGGDMGQEFWNKVAMLAVGETLQRAVDSDRVAFKDDICGVSLSVRFTSYIITIWNRDGEHEKGIAQILETVKKEVLEQLQLKEVTHYYKRHSEHAAFKGPRNAVDRMNVT